MHVVECNVFLLKMDSYFFSSKLCAQSLLIILVYLWIVRLQIFPIWLFSSILNANMSSLFSNQVLFIMKNICVWFIILIPDPSNERIIVEKTSFKIITFVGIKFRGFSKMTISTTHAFMELWFCKKKKEFASVSVYIMCPRLIGWGSHYKRFALFITCKLSRQLLWQDLNE